VAKNAHLGGESLFGLRSAEGFVNPSVIADADHSAWGVFDLFHRWEDALHQRRDKLAMSGTCGDFRQAAGSAEHRKNLRHCARGIAFAKASARRKQGQKGLKPQPQRSKRRNPLKKRHQPHLNGEVQTGISMA
jgi:hypothetical protein